VRSREGRLERALRAASRAEAACAPLAAEARAGRLDLLVEIGDDEAARELASSLAASPDAPPALAARAREILARPVRPRTRADLRSGDDLRARGDLPGALAAYQKAVSEHPRDIVALGALAEVELASAHPEAARRLLDRAVRAAGGHVRIAAFETRFQRGPTIDGVLRPDVAKVALLCRLAGKDAGFPWATVGDGTFLGPQAVLSFGEGRPLSISSLDGRETRATALRDATDAAFTPGGEAIIALSRGKVHRVDAGSGAIAGSHPAAGGALGFAGPSRLVVGREVFRLPELTPAYTIAEHAQHVKRSPRAVAYVEAREVAAPRARGRAPSDQEPAWRQFLVVRRADDGRTLFERDIAGTDFDTTVDFHPSGRFVAWIGEAWTNKFTPAGILDIETGKVATFPYRGVRQTPTLGLRITRDGRSACAYDLGWTAPPGPPGTASLCWIHEGEAVIVYPRLTRGFTEVQFIDVHGSLSPDGKLAAFIERRTDDNLVVAARVIDAVTGKDVRRFELARVTHYQPDATMVSNTVMEVATGTASDGYYDVRTGARVEAPADARMPRTELMWDPEHDGKSVGPPAVHVVPSRGFLAIHREGKSTCWSLDLREVPLESCRSKGSDDVAVKAGVARIKDRTEPVRLALPLESARGFLAKVGEAEVIVVQDEWTARYFSLAGELVGTVAAVGLKRPVGFLPGGAAALAGEGDEGRESLTCLAGDRVLPWEACADREVPVAAFVRRIQGAEAQAEP
jgi:tetratricopeptide (TPR) repeat protein